MSSSENEAIEAISKALEGELDGVDVDQIVNFKLKRLDRDYNQTLAAEIPPSSTLDPGWQADFTDTYEKCPSDEDSPDEDLLEPATRDFPMSPEKVQRIKEIMSKVKLNPPFWIRNIPDSAFSEMVSQKLLK